MFSSLYYPRWWWLSWCTLLAASLPPPVLASSTGSSAILPYHATISTCAEKHCGPTRRDPEDRETCRCDPDCASYSDCCYDSPHFLQAGAETRQRWACVRASPAYSYYMVGECPTLWTGSPTVRESCAGTSSSSLRLDPLLSLPVTSVTAPRLTYRNAFCAACHGEAGIRVWDAKLYYDEELSSDYNVGEEFISKNLFFNPNASSWGVQVDGSFFEIKVSSKVPDDEKLFVRECISDTTDKCGQPSTEESQKLCESYTYIVYDSDGNSYKNPDCAKCNGIPVANVSCSRTKDRGGIWESSIPLSMIISMSSKTPDGGDDGVYDVFTKRYRRWGEEIAAIRENLVPIDDVEPESNADPRCNIALEKYDEHVMANGVNLLSQSLDTFPYGDVIVLNDGETVTCAPNIPVIDDSQFSNGERIISFIGYDLSIVFLLIHLGFYTTNPERNKMAQMNTASLSVALLLSYITLLIGNSFKGELCTAVAIILSYSLLASFFWMSVIAYDIWNMLKTTDEYLQAYVGSKRVRFSVYSAVAWLTPGLLVAGGALADSTSVLPEEWRPAYGVYTCWYGRPKGLMAFFFAPFFLAMALNIIFFALSGLIVHTIRSAVHTSRKRKYKVYLKMAITMGLTWSIGLIAIAYDNVILRYMFIILNSCQGVYICCTHTFSRLRREESTNDLFARISSKLKLTSLTSFSRQKSYEMTPHAQENIGKVEMMV